MPAFDAEVRAAIRGSYTVVVPKHVLDELPSRRVRVWIGSEAFEATLGAYGGRTFLGLKKSLLTALGVAAGDHVHVELEPADPAAEPEVEAAPDTCPELDEALVTDAPLRQAWSALAAGHQEEYGRWVSSASEPDVRQTRITRLRHRLIQS